MNRKDTLILHLDRDYTEPVRDPLWKHIYLSPALLRIIDSRPFQQLHRIKQLGPSYLVYPGATHSRLNHSLGVFHIARRLVRALVAHDGAPDLSEEGVRAFLCAALLHDVGHFPYTHSLKELPLREHESLTGSIVQEEPLASLIRDGLGVEPGLVAAIVDLSIPVPPKSELLFFRHLLSGPLDPDKLDYLNRDAYFCGVPYGVQDIDFAISRLRPYGSETIAIDISGVSVVESILFSKYLMHRAVYWHRTVRVATAMIKKAVYLALRAGVVVPEDLYGLDDDSFFASLSDVNFPALDLVRRVPQRKLYKVIWEAPFDDANPNHRSLESLDRRDRVENRIAQAITSETGTRKTTPVTSEEVIVDIPERISFEVSMQVWNGSSTIPYLESGTVFTPKVVQDFTRTLRRIRVAVPEEIADSVPYPDRIVPENLQ